MPRILVILVLTSLMMSNSFGAEDEVCRVIKNDVETMPVKALEKSEPTSMSGSLCDYGEVPCDKFTINPITLDSLKKRGVSLENLGLQYILENGYYIRVAQVDINNDKLPDLRFTQVMGTAGCQKNHFLLRNSDNTYVEKEFKEFDELTTEGGFCGRDSLVVRRVNNVNYLVAVSAYTTVVFRGMPDGSLANVCSFMPKERWSEEQILIANIIREKYPDMPAEVRLERPELEQITQDNFEPFAKKGEMVWEVMAACEGARHAYAMFVVHPLRKDVMPTLEPGGESSRCD